MEHLATVSFIAAMSDVHKARVRKQLCKLVATQPALRSLSYAEIPLPDPGLLRPVAAGAIALGGIRGVQCGRGLAAQCEQQTHSVLVP
jgi:hypothetical protein